MKKSKTRFISVLTLFCVFIVSLVSCLCLLTACSDTEPESEIVHTRNEELQKLASTSNHGLYESMSYILTYPYYEYDEDTKTLYVDTNIYPYIYLDQDFTLNIVVRANSAVMICLHGHTLTAASGSAIVLEEGASGIILCDCDTEHNGTLTGGTGTEVTVDGTSFVAGGAIFAEDNAGDIWWQGGNLTGNSAEIGGAIYIGKGSSFYSYVGVTYGWESEISGNEATYDGSEPGGGRGGAIYSNGGYIELGSTLNGYRGPTISNNTATASSSKASPYSGGGAIYAVDSYVYIHQDTRISYNFTDGGYGGGGIALYGSSTLIIEDSEISDNEAKGGGGIYASGDFEITISGSTISGNTATDTLGGGGMYISGGFASISDTEISQNSAISGGGLYIGSADVEIGTGTEICKNSAENTGSLSNVLTYGGGIYMKPGAGETSSLAISGGEISNNSATCGGGIYAADSDGSSSAITLSGGSVDYNTASEGGGGAYFKGNLSFTMKSGSVSYNTSFARGGGITMTEGSNGSPTALVSGGKISYNTAETYGGGVDLSSGVFSLSGGEISYNETVGDAYSSGAAGVFMGAGTTFEMSGGSIDYNKTYGMAGGVSLSQSCTFAMTGGEIAGNKAAAYGGVYTPGNATFSLSGKVNIKNNYDTLDENTATYDMSGNLSDSDYVTKSDLLVLSSGQITLTGALSSGSSVGLAFDGGEKGVVTKITATEESTKYYQSSYSYFSLDYSDMGYRYVVSADTGNKCVALTNNSTYAAYTVNASSGAKTYYKTYDLGYNAAHGKSAVSYTLYLNNDVTLTDVVSEAYGIYNLSDKYVLDLNGHTISTTKSRFMCIDAGGTFTLCDSTGYYGVLENGKDSDIGTKANGDGTYTTVYKAYDEDNKAYYGTYTAGCITGVNMTSGYGSVFVYSGATMYMYGGIIAGNTTLRGGGICVTGGCSVGATPGYLYMYGGSVSDNTSRSYGGGIDFGNAGQGAIYGGIVSNNVATTYGGGVSFKNANSYTTGATLGIESDDAIEIGTRLTITSNTAKDGHGGGLYVGYGNVTMYACDIADNSTPAGLGGGAYIAGSGVSYGTLYLYGGRIMNNSSISTADYGGAGVYAGGKLYIAGDAYVYDNDWKLYNNNTIYHWTQSNVYLAGSQYINIDADFSGYIGFHTSTLFDNKTSAQLSTKSSVAYDYDWLREHLVGDVYGSYGSCVGIVNDYYIWVYGAHYYVGEDSFEIQWDEENRTYVRINYCSQCHKPYSRSENSYPLQYKVVNGVAYAYVEGSDWEISVEIENGFLVQNADGSCSWYSDFEDALENANDGATIILYDDASGGLVEKENVSIYLNGHDIGSLEVGGSICISGEGYVYSLDVHSFEGASATLSGGTYRDDILSDDAVSIASGYVVAVRYDESGEKEYIVTDSATARSGAAAYVTVNGEIVYFDSFEDAMEYANANAVDGETVSVTLLQDIENANVEISTGDVTLNLGGHELTGAISVSDGASLTLAGNGEIDAVVSVAENGSLNFSASSAGIDVTLDSGSTLCGTVDATSGSVSIDLGGNEICGNLKVENNATLTVSGSGSISADITVAAKTQENANDQGILIISADEKDSFGEGGINISIGENSDMSGDLQVSSGYVEIDLSGNTIENLSVGDGSTRTSANVVVIDSSYENSGTISNIVTSSMRSGDRLSINGGEYDEDLLETVYANLGTDHSIMFDSEENVFEVVESSDVADASATVTVVTETGMSVVYFDSLDDAIAYAENSNADGETGVTVTLLKDAESIKFSSGSVTLDLNGFGVSSLEIGDEDSATTADVTIVDSSEKKSGYVTKVSLLEDDESENALTIFGGSYSENQISELYKYLDEGKSFFKDSKNVMYLVTDEAMPSSSVAASVTYEANGETVTVYFDDAQAALNFAQNLASATDLEVSDVKVVLYDDADDLEISSGEIELDLNGHKVGELTIGDGNASNGTTSVTVSDSSGSGFVSTLSEPKDDSGDEVKIAGGTYTEDVADCLAEGYVEILGTDKDGNYTYRAVASDVVEDIAAVCVEIEDYTYYFDSVETAIKYIEENEVSSAEIKLLSDLEMSAASISSSNITIDLNGHTLAADITVNADCNGVAGAGGKLTVKDSSANHVGSLTGKISVVGQSSDTQPDNGDAPYQNTYEDTLTFENVAPNRRIVDIDLSGLLGANDQAIYWFSAISGEDPYSTYYGITVDHDHSYTIAIWDRLDDGTYVLSFMCSCGEFEYTCNCEGGSCTCQDCECGESGECTCDIYCDCTSYVEYPAGSVTYDYDKTTGKVTIATCVTFEEGDPHYDAYFDDEKGASSITFETTFAPAAYVETSEGKAYFESLEDAVAYAESEAHSDESVVIVILDDEDADITITGSGVSIDLNGFELSGSVKIADGATLTVTGSGKIDAAFDVVESGKLVIAQSDNEERITVILEEGSSFEGEIDVEAGDVSIDLNGLSLGTLVVGDGSSSVAAHVAVTDTSSGNLGSIGNIDTSKMSGDDSLRIEGGTYGENLAETIYGNLGDDSAIIYDIEGYGGEGAYEVVDKAAAEAGASASVTVQTSTGVKTVYFDDLSKAIAYAEEMSTEDDSSVTLTLLGDVSGGMQISDGSLILDLNGYTVDSLTVGDASTSDGYEDTAAAVTIVDMSEEQSGTVESFVVNGNGQSAEKNTLIIAGGTYAEERIEEIVEYLDDGSALYKEEGSDGYKVVSESEAKASSKVVLTYIDAYGETVEIYFESIEDAADFANSQDGDVAITLLCDIMDCDISITGSNITIDLDGHSLYGDVDVERGATLTIKGDGEVVLEAGSVVRGTIEIESGTVTVDLNGNSVGTLEVGDGDPSNGCANVTVKDSSENLSGSVTNLSEPKEESGDSLTITGGTFYEDVSDYIASDAEIVLGKDSSGETYRVVDANAVEDVAAASVTIGNDVVYFETFEDAVEYANANGGTLTLYENVEPGDVSVSGNFVLDLNGNELVADITVSAGASLTITDSDSSAPGFVTGHIECEEGGAVAVNAGTYSEDVSEYLEAGFVVLIDVNGDGQIVYEVLKEDAMSDAAVRISDENGNDRYYLSAEAAFADCDDGDTITLLKNIELEENKKLVLSAYGNVTLDLAGFSIDGDFAIGEGSQSVILTITDSSDNKSGSIDGELSTGRNAMAILEGGTYADDPRDFGNIALGDGYAMVYTNAESYTVKTVEEAQNCAAYVATEKLTVIESTDEDGNVQTMYSTTFVIVYFDDITEAVAYAEKMAAEEDTTSVTISLLQNVTKEEGITIADGEITLDLNGHDVSKITVGDDDVGTCASVTIVDSSDEKGTVSSVTVIEEHEKGQENENTLSIEGGAYSDAEDILEYVDEDDFALVNDGERYIVASRENIGDVAEAMVTCGDDEIYFAHLSDAIDYVSANGGRITLLSDAEIEKNISKDVSIDLNGHTLTAEIAVDANGGSLAISDSSDGEGKISGTITVSDSDDEKPNDEKDYSSTLVLDGVMIAADLEVDLTNLGMQENNATGALETTYVFAKANDTYGIVARSDHTEHTYEIDVWSRDGASVTMTLRCACGEYLEDENGDVVAFVADVTYTYDGDEEGTYTLDATVTVDGVTYVYTETIVAVASVTATVDGKRTTVYFDDFEDALKYAEENNGYLTLLEDVVADIEISEGNVSLDLNGFTLVGDITVGDGNSSTSASLTILDTSYDVSGAVSGNLSVATAGSDRLILNGGTYNFDILDDDSIETANGSYILVGKDENGNDLYTVTDEQTAKSRAEASVTVQDATMYFESFEEAFEYAKAEFETEGSAVTLTLFEDIENLQIEDFDITIDLNGHSVDNLTVGDEELQTSAAVTIIDSSEEKSGYVNSLTVTNNGENSAMVAGGTYRDDISRMDDVDIADGSYVLVKIDDEGNDIYFVTDSDTAKENAAASVIYTDDEGEEHTVYFEDVASAAAYAEQMDMVYSGFDDTSVTLTLYDDASNITIHSGEITLDLNGHEADSLIVGDENGYVAAVVTIIDSSDEKSGRVDDLVVNNSGDGAGTSNYVIADGGIYGTNILDRDDVTIAEGRFAFETKNGEFLVTDEDTAMDMASASVTYTDEEGEEHTVYFEDINAATEYATDVAGKDGVEDVLLTLFGDADEIDISSGFITVDLNGHSVETLVVGDDAPDTSATVTIVDSGNGEGHVDNLELKQAADQIEENSIAIEGGTYTEDVSDYLDEIHSTIFGTDENGSPTFTVANVEEMENMAAAKVNSGSNYIYFASVEDAVNYAAESGGTVTLLKDAVLFVEISDALTHEGDFVSLTIDLNGHTLSADITVDAASGSLEITDGVGGGKVVGSIFVMTSVETDEDDFSSSLVFNGVIPNENLEIDLSELGLDRSVDENGSVTYANKYVFEQIQDGIYKISKASEHSHSYTIAVWTRENGTLTLRLLCACGEYYTLKGEIVEYEVEAEYTKLENGTVSISAQTTVTVDNVDATYTYSETITPLASVTVTDENENETVIYFDDLQDAVNFAQNAAATVTLLADADGDIVATSDVTIDLNGNALSGSFCVESGIATILDDSQGGTINLDCDITVKSEASLVIGNEEGNLLLDIFGSINIEEGGTAKIYGSGEMGAEIVVSGEMDITSTNGVDVYGDITLDGGEINANGTMSAYGDITAVEGTKNYIGGENAILDIEGPIVVEEGAILEIEGSGEIGSTFTVEDGGTFKIAGTEDEGIALEIKEDTYLSGTLALDGDVTLALNGNDLDVDLEIENESNITIDGQGGMIRLEDDLETSGTTVTVTSDTTIDVAGHEMAIESDSNGDGGIYVDSGTLNIADGEYGGSLSGDVTVSSGAGMVIRDDVLDGYATDFTVTFEDNNYLLSSAMDEFDNIYYETVTAAEHKLSGCNYDFVTKVSFDAATCTMTIEFTCLCGESWSESSTIDESGYTAYAGSNDEGEDAVVVDVSTAITVFNPVSGVTYTHEIIYKEYLSMYTEGETDENYTYSYTPAGCYATGCREYTYGTENGVKVTEEVPKTHTAVRHEYNFTLRGVTYTVVYYECSECGAVLFSSSEEDYDGDSNGVYETDDMLKYGSVEDYIEDMENYVAFEEAKDELAEALENYIGENTTGHMGTIGSVNNVYNKLLEDLEDMEYESQTGSSDDRKDYMDSLSEQLAEMQAEAEFEIDVALTQNALKNDIDNLYQEMVESGSYTDEALEELNEAYHELLDGVDNLQIEMGDDLDEIYERFLARIYEILYKIRMYLLNALDGEGEIVGSVINDESGFDGDAKFVIERTDTFDLDYIMYDFTFVSMDTGEALTDEEIEALFDGKSVLAGYAISITSGDVEITVFSGVYTIKILLPDDLAYTGELTVVYVGNDGMVEVYAATVDEDGYIVFETTHFSNYYIVGEAMEESAYGSVMTFLGIVLIVELILAAILLGLYFAKRCKSTKAKVLWTLLFALVAAAGVAITISMMALVVTLSSVVTLAILCAAMLVADVMFLYFALEASEKTSDEAALAQEKA